MRLRDVLARKAGELPAIVHVHPDESVRAAIAILGEFGVSQIPVVTGETLATRHDVVGSVRERGLLDRVYKDPSILDATVRDVMDEPLPILDARDTVDAAMALLTGAAGAALVCEGPSRSACSPAPTSSRTSRRRGPDRWPVSSGTRRASRRAQSTPGRTPTR